jgi:hypothetical protein
MMRSGMTFIGNSSELLTAFNAVVADLKRDLRTGSQCPSLSSEADVPDQAEQSQQGNPHLDDIPIR